MKSVAWSYDLAVPGGAWTALALGLGLLVLLGLSLARLRSEPHKARRYVLGALRVATASTAFVVAVQPRFIEETTETKPGKLAVLADLSRSMGVRVPGQPSRADEARALLGRWANEAEAREVATFSFGDRAQAASMRALAAAYPAEEDASRLADALEIFFGDGEQVEGAATEDKSDVGAVLVISDGADSTAERTRARLRGSELRVHAVAVGADEALRDDAISEAKADAKVFLREPARLRVRVRSLGGTQRTLPVTLYRDDEVVREANVEVAPDSEATVDLSFTADTLGRAVYRVVVPTAADDAVPENNERAFLVEVVRDKLRVLLLCGRPSWDERFLRSLLKRDASIDLISFFILRSSSDLTMASPDELALIPFPTDELFSEHLESFDLVIFQNFDFGPYQMAGYLPRIREYVLGGGAFAMIGGDLSFASGGYRETPIAEILPVEMGGAGPVPELLTEAFAPRTVAASIHHPVVALGPDPEATAAVWRRLATVEGANGLAGLAANASALLEHPSARDAHGGPMPVLATGEFGKGRTLALGIDGSWRWGITTGGLTGDASVHGRFWDRAIRWLTRDPLLDAARLSTDRERYAPRARVGVEASLRDARYTPLIDAEVSLHIVDASGARLAETTARTDAKGTLRATMRAPARAGGYRVIASSAGPPLITAEQSFVVEAGGDELADPRSRPGWLEELAQKTGGTFVRSPRDAPSLSAFDSSRVHRVGAAESRPFASAWIVLGLIALFGAEWILRRAFGHA